MHQDLSAFVQRCVEGVYLVKHSVGENVDALRAVRTLVQELRDVGYVHLQSLINGQASAVLSALYHVRDTALMKGAIKLTLVFAKAALTSDAQARLLLGCLDILTSASLEVFGNL